MLLIVLVLVLQLCSVLAVTEGLSALSDSLEVSVDTTHDLVPANSSACTPGATPGQCSLRSAMVLCEDHLVDAARTCTVLLPPGETLAVNTSQGQISFTSSEAAGTLVLDGAGSVISALDGERVNTNRRFLLVDITAGKSFSVQISNVIISNFGTEDTVGGAIWMQNLASGSMTDVSYKSNSGDSAGAVYLDQSPNFLFLRCMFESNTAVNDGGALLVDTYSSGLTFQSCQFLANSVELGLGGGLFLRNYNDDVLLNGCNFTENYAVRG